MNTIICDHPPLKAKRLGLFTHDQAVVIMRTDCPACHSAGLSSRSHIQVYAGDRSIYAVLLQIDSELLELDTIGMSQTAWDLLDVEDGDEVEVRLPPALTSLSHIRSRIYGNRFDYNALSAIIDDVVARRYTDVHLAAFLTASATPPLDTQETIYLTRAMIGAGERLDWNKDIVLDKHCVGGLPGNRTTPLVVAIVTAHGLTMPKTSSRAITSPAGTADTMETMTPVNLELGKLKQVVKEQGGCIAWGGAVQLSPADDVFIRVERDLDIDTEGQLVASVLSKKVAAGSTHVVIDIPVGPTAKVRNIEAADQLANLLTSVGKEFGLTVACLYTNGSQPVGHGIGPALEALDVLAVLRNEEGAPQDLRERAAVLAGAALEIGGVAEKGQGTALALKTIADGRAWAKFCDICIAQGGLKIPEIAPHSYTVTAPSDGIVYSIDNRNLARVAKLAGAPRSTGAGIRMEVRLGDHVRKGQPFFTIYAAAPGELIYAVEFANEAETLVNLQLTLPVVALV